MGGCGAKRSGLYCGACTPWRERHQQTNICFDLSAGEETQTEDDYNKFFLKYDDDTTIDVHSLGDDSEEDNLSFT